MKKYKLLVIIATILILLVTGGCQTNKSNSPDSLNHHALKIGEQHRLPNGDLQELTASINHLPAFLDQHGENMQLIYQAAAQNSELLQWIPCYCGCADSAGHGDNGNCFYKEIYPDGTVLWDDHSTRCNVCLETAIYSIKMQNEGASIREIREWVDETYKEGYAKPTPTPMPQG